MVSILDISPSHKAVKTKHGNIEVPGLSVSGIVYLVKNFPVLMDMFNGKVDTDKLIALGPQITAEFIAAGLGHPGNEKAVSNATSLIPEDTFNLVLAIMEESFPGGAGNFFQRVATTLNAVQNTSTGNQKETAQS